MTFMLVEIIRFYFPATRAVYIFWSCVGETDTGESEVGIALLLPHADAKAAGSLAHSDARFELEKRPGQSVDLVNLRNVSTVFRKEIIASGRRVGSYQDVRTGDHPRLSTQIVSLGGRSGSGGVAGAGTETRPGNGRGAGLVPRRPRGRGCGRDPGAAAS
jgi:hypothetical protein